VEATYSDYKDLGGLKVPGRMVQKRGGFTFFDVTVANARRNPDDAAALLAGPAPAAGRGGRGGGRTGGPGGAAATPPPPSTKLSDGLYQINGAYNALAVEFEDYIVVVEAGQPVSRGQAIVDEVKKLFPSKPIRFQADFTLPQGGAKPNPFVQSLGENVAKLKLDFDSYLSVHNSPLQQTRKDLMTATGVSY
jgi:hypothetical protein